MIKGFILLTFLHLLQPHAYSSAQECFDIFKPTKKTELPLEILNQSKFKGFGEDYSKDNIKFIKFVKSEKKSNLTFFRIENSLMKQLNDEILKNKELSYSISLSFQKLFLRNLQKLHPSTFRKISYKYHDFKSLNLAFNRNTDLHHIEEVFKKTSTDFGQSLKKELSQRKIRISEKYQNFDNWHKAAFAESVDKAALATKITRGSKANRVVFFEEIEHKVEQIKKELSSYWKTIELEAGQSNLANLIKLTPTNERFSFINLDIINLARKAQTKTSFYSDFVAIYPEIKSFKLISAYYDYIKSAEKITASVLTPKSTSLALAKDPGVIYSIDIGQMGAEGILETIKRTRGINNTNTIISEARNAFWQADQSLKSFYKKINDSFQSDIDPETIKLAFKVSGDDALFDFGRALTPMRQKLTKLIINKGNPDKIIALKMKINHFHEKWSFYNPEGFDNYIRRISEYEQAYRFRITSINPRFKNLKVIPKKAITPLIEMGESFEKALRKSFLKTSEIGVLKNKEIVLGIESHLLSLETLQQRIVIVNKSSLDNKMIEDHIRRFYENYITKNASSFKYNKPEIKFIN